MKNPPAFLGLLFTLMLTFNTYLPTYLPSYLEAVNVLRERGRGRGQA